MIFLLVLLLSSQNVEDSSQICRKMGKYIGHMIGQQFKDSDIPLRHIIEGLEDVEKGITPNISREEFLMRFRELEQKKDLIQPKEILQRSQVLLAKIANEKKIQSVVPEKLYIDIIYPGTGKTIKNVGLFHIMCHTITNKTLIDTRSEGIPVLQELDEAIEGFSLGVKGMKEGERRKLYIHPDLGYGDTGIIAKNSALIIDVELVKALSD